MNNTVIQDVNMDNIKNIMNDIVSDYCIQNDIDQNNIHPLVWNDILLEINDVIFRRNKTLLKFEPNINNAYDKEKVLYVYGLYKRLCLKHEKVINLKGFQDLVGIDNQTLYDWNNGPSQVGSDLYQKIMSDNEQSLEAMLQDKSTNPMKVLPSLNRHHHWNMPGVTKEITPRKALGVDQLPQLGQKASENVVQIAQLENDEK